MVPTVGDSFYGRALKTHERHFIVHVLLVVRAVYREDILLEVGAGEG